MQVNHDASTAGEGGGGGQEGHGDVQDHLQREPAAVDGEGVDGFGGGMSAARGLGKVRVRQNRVSIILLCGGVHGMICMSEEPGAPTMPSFVLLWCFNKPFFLFEQGVCMHAW